MQLQLPKLLQTVIQQLKQREEGPRDATRATLVKINALLGPPYFGYILDSLKTTLRRGYELQILGFTIHTLLLEAIQGRGTATGGGDGDDDPQKSKSARAATKAGEPTAVQTLATEKEKGIFTINAYHVSINNKKM